MRLSRLAAAGSYSSLSLAAFSLGIEPSVLISQVNRLEREVGHRLLDRVPGQQAMRPAAYGQKVIAAIRAASATRPASDIRPRRSRKRHELETDLDDIAVIQARNRRPTKINMSRAVRAYKAVEVLSPCSQSGGTWMAYVPPD